MTTDRQIGMIFSPSPDVNIDDAAQALKRAGVNLIQRLDSVGMILGQARADRIGELQALPEIHSVTLDQQVNIAPPDADIQ